MKEQFIRAYIYNYGSTKKQAEKVYKECIQAGKIEYINAILDGYYNETKKAFYQD